MQENREPHAPQKMRQTQQTHTATGVVNSLSRRRCQRNTLPTEQGLYWGNTKVKSWLSGLKQLELWTFRQAVNPLSQTIQNQYNSCQVPILHNPHWNRIGSIYSSLPPSAGDGSGVPWRLSPLGTPATHPLSRSGRGRRRWVNRLVLSLQLSRF